MYGNKRFGGDRGGFAPVKVGDEIDLKIEAVGEKGDGIGKVKGFVIFVPNTKQGDEVKVKITRVLRKVAFGEVVGQGSASSESSEQAEETQSEESSEESEESNEEESDEGSEEF